MLVKPTQKTFNLWSDGMGRWSYYITKNIIKFAFPDVTIVEDWFTTPDLVIKSRFPLEEECPQYTCPYITWSGESTDVPPNLDAEPLLNLTSFYSTKPDTF